MKCMFRAILAAVLWIPFVALGQNHTVNNETNNNTSGCNSPTATYVGLTSCQANFAGAKDDSSAGTDNNNAPNNPTPNQVVDTVTFTAVPKNVADFTDDGVDIHSLVYPGYTGPVFVNMVLWHDGPGINGNGFNYTPKQPNPPGENTFNNHYMTGYISDNSNQIAAQFAYMQRLKVDGIVANPPGPLPPAMASQQTKNKNVNDAVEQFKVKADGTSSFLYTVMTDQVMWEQNQHTRCGGGAGRNVTPDCVERIMICSLDYMNTATASTFVCALDGLSYNGGGYFADSHYWKVNSRPVLSYFLDASLYFGSGVCSTAAPCSLYNDNQGGLTCTGSDDCWGKIWGNITQGIAHHIAGFSVKPYIIHRNTSGPAGTGAPNDGTYRWLNPSQDQTYLNFGVATVDSQGYDLWLSSAFSSPPAVYLSLGYGKVDHAQSPFEIGDHKIMDARCGQTFLDSMGRPAFKGFGTSHPLQAIEIATWDDYDEGTEMETGIDICINTFSASLNGSTLNWSITFNNAQFGNEAKIDHYTIYYTSDGSINTSIDHPLTALANVPVNNTGSYSYALPSTLPNPTILYVKAVAKPMLQNRLAAGVVFNPHTQATGILGFAGQFSCQDTQICDTGTISVTVNTTTKTTGYDGACSGAPPFGFSYSGNPCIAQTIAQTLVNAFNSDPNSPVTASINMDTYAAANAYDVVFTAKQPGTGGNYTTSISVVSNYGNFQPFGDNGNLIRWSWTPMPSTGGVDPNTLTEITPLSGSLTGGH